MTLDRASPFNRGKCPEGDPAVNCQYLNLRISASILRRVVMVNFLLYAGSQCPDTRSTIVLDVSVKMFVDEANT